MLRGGYAPVGKTALEVGLVVRPEDALVQVDRILSRYKPGDGRRIHLITEADSCGPSRYASPWMGQLQPFGNVNAALRDGRYGRQWCA